MVAKTSILDDRFAPPPDPLAVGRMRLVRFTRHDAEALVRLGIIPEDTSTELLNGMIVLKDRSARDQDPTMIGQEHRRCVERLSSLRKVIDDARRHVESQQPLVCNDTQVPEPDFMVLRGTLNDYTDLPNAEDALCVVEVADSSYERDAGEKLKGYARAGLAQYLIVNLRNRTIEVYTKPDATTGAYPLPQIFSAGQVVPLRVGPEDFFDIRVDDVLP